MTINEIIILASIGLAAGAFSGMFGIGGGMIMVPALVFFLAMSQHSAQGTSLGVLVIPVAAIAAWNYHKEGELNIKFAAIIALSFVVGGYFGSKLSLGLSELMLKRMFGILMLLMAIRLIFFSKATPV